MAFSTAFDWSKWKTFCAKDQLSILPAAQNHVLGQPEGKKRFVETVSDLSKAFALAVPSEKALAIRDDVGFFQAVRSVLTKGTPAKDSAVMISIMPSGRLFREL